MTFCVGIKIADGLVGIADTRITAGTKLTTAQKVSIHHHGDYSIFLMTSGLRSVRDKAVTYFEEALEAENQEFDKLYKAVNAYAAQVRRVASEDKKALAEAGLNFNLHSIVGGQMANDKEHKLYLLYPQGNWIEIGAGTPYILIGESAYGKPVLDRVLRYESSMELALKVGYLAFDSTRISATDVDFPIDVVLYRRGSYTLVQHRYEHKDLQHLPEWWQAHLRGLVENLPSEWASEALAKLPGNANPTLVLSKK